VSPSVDFSSQTFARLQAHAVPLVDTIETVINRFIDYYEAKGGIPAPPASSDSGSVDDDPPKIRQFSPTTPPHLTHTKVLAVEVCGKSLDHSQVTWSGLLFAAIREAKARVKSTTEFKHLVLVNFVDGQKTDEGYRYLSDIGISVQGQDANASWKAAYHVAQQLGFQLSVTFIWRQKEGATFPGVTGQLSVTASKF
jgi:hypothetical protein